MNKNVLIISSTPRKGGNSDILCDEFAAGAKEAGNKVEKIRIADKKIGYCTGCYACQKTGKCAIKDDAQKVIDKMMVADVIVLASPVYFYSISAQLKALFDRTVVVYPNLTNKKFYFLLTMADTNRKMFDGSLAALRGFLACLLRRQQGVRQGLRFRRVRERHGKGHKVHVRRPQARNKSEVKSTKSWHMKRQKLSARPTTRWDELMTVK